MELWQIPPETLARYLKVALEKSQFERLEDGSWYGEIPGFQGVWANGASQEECRQVLGEVLLEWLALKLKDGDTDIPVVEGINLLSYT